MSPTYLTQIQVAIKRMVLHDILREEESQRVQNQLEKLLQ
jgi:hypothetical protein